MVGVPCACEYSRASIVVRARGEYVTTPLALFMNIRVMRSALDRLRLGVRVAASASASAGIPYDTVCPHAMHTPAHLDGMTLAGRGRHTAYDRLGSPSNLHAVKPSLSMSWSRCLQSRHVAHAKNATPDSLFFTVPRSVL